MDGRQCRIVGDTVRIWEFVRRFMPIDANGSMKALGLERPDGRLISGVLYEGFNGRNAWMHVALEPGARWTRRFLWYAFHYPFVEMGLHRLSGYVEASNTAAMRVDLHLGFKPEARLHGAAGDGGDVVVMVMWRAQCRFLNLMEGRDHGIEEQRECASA